MHKRAAIDPTVIVVCTRSRAAKATFSDAPFGRAQSSFAFAAGGSIYLSETGSFYLSAVGNRGQPVFNQKCGNKYLAWAFVEAAHFARRSDDLCRRWYDRKAAKTSTVIATKALACKLAKAAWYLMAEGSEYDERRVFPELAEKAQN